MRLLALFFLCFLVLGGSAGAATLEQIFGEAQAAYKGGEYEKAVSLFQQAADVMLKAKEPAKAQMLLGNAAIAAMKGEQYDVAAGIYGRILKLPGKLPQEQLYKIYQNLIACQSKLGQQALKIQTTENMFKAIPKLPSPELANAYAQLGDAYRALELYAAAASSYGKSLHLQAKDTSLVIKARLLTAQGLCQGNLGNFRSAAESLKKAAEISRQTGEASTIAEADSNLGILHWERADYGQASVLLNKALETEKQHSLLRNEGVDRNNMGLVEKSAGRIQAAMEYFEAALAIARKVDNKRDEAIALSNRALLNRMTGNLQEARADYREALKLYEEVGFNEGRAGALLGIGKMAELEDRNLEVALNNYSEALEIYSSLALQRSQAEALLQVGGIYKRALAPGRTTRDLVFDDAPVQPKASKEESFVRATEAYTKALQLAEAVSSKEMIWAARQGLGFVLMQQGKLDEAFEQYSKAIQMVGTLRASLKSVSLLGEYMAGKEDLYGEGMELCALLYEKTKQQKYITQQLEWDETLRNEVQKASAALVQMQFGDKKKQAVYDNLMQTARQLEKAESAIPVVKTLPATATQEDKAQHKLVADAAKAQKLDVQKLEGDYAKHLAQWKKDYPADAVMFESAARIDIPKVQKALKDDQVLLQYVPLRDKLIIVAISTSAVDTYVSNVGVEQINQFIKKKFLIDYAEGYRKRESVETEKEGLDVSVGIMSTFYDWFIRPVEKSLQNKVRLYIASSGFIAQVPFVALVSSVEDNKRPRFLVEDYEISNIRPSFIASLTDGKEKKPTKKLLAIGNPHNSSVSMKNLDGAKKEVQDVNASLPLESDKKDIEFEKSANETWFFQKLQTTGYEILYFATHGMPYSEVYYLYFLNAKRAIPQVAENLNKPEEIIREEFKFVQQELPSASPLNGYLYLADDKKNKKSGLLTIKKITEMPEKSLEKTRFVVLSACNTGVTFAPKTLSSNKTAAAMSEKTIEQELRKAGWVPGVDQISFTDVFMRRNVSNVYGTLWFADDAATSYIMASAMKEIYIENKEQNVVAGYTTALRKYLAEARNNEGFLGNGRNVASNPFYWACGAIFGK